MSSNMGCMKYIANSLKYLKLVQQQVVQELAHEYKTNPPVATDLFSRLDYQVR